MYQITRLHFSEDINLHSRLLVEKYTSRIIAGLHRRISTSTEVPSSEPWLPGDQREGDASGGSVEPSLAAQRQLALLPVLGLCAAYDSHHDSSLCHRGARALHHLGRFQRLCEHRVVRQQLRCIYHQADLHLGSDGSGAFCIRLGALLSWLNEVREGSTNWATRVTLYMPNTHMLPRGRVIFEKAINRSAGQ